MTTLEKEIQELKDKHTLKESISKKVPNIKNTSFLFDYKRHKTNKSINFDLLDSDNKKQDIKRILKAYKPKNNIIHYNGKEDIKTLSPFVLTFNNECTHKQTVKISFVSGKNHVSIKLPVSFYKDATINYNRFLYSNEHHYFTGVSQSKLNKMTVQASVIEDSEYSKFWGGSAVHFNTCANETESFNNTVLTGESFV